ncbi:type VII secretion protein EccB [Streptomyces sp. UH6]|uniref:type VII secretion protein EccB n=1 Tax=Streptomyces sp. UH6 TaxID=2748379 RepID=UPI0015D4DCEF|nr:type VII secretion protein EccB [Streptomyces sp. UH6]NYV75781.1 type VII secretion protein EccB [Streptomyces sp. UH6]
MASRRDQLNAYTFAKRRMLASFTHSASGGSEESAPRPLRGILPGMITGVVVMAVFGAWGMFKPTAPKDWDRPYEKVIVADKSTTRYVVLKTGGKTQLHPVLNMASAKLLLKDGKGDVITVDEKILDTQIQHGVTVGIPYAPDRLPDAGEAAAEKRWVVCERAGEGGAVQKAAFVFAAREMKRVEGSQRLSGGQLLYVQGPDDARYVVDATGTGYRIDAVEKKEPELSAMLRAVVGSDREPQRVSREWLETLHKGDPLAFPEIDGPPGRPADAPGQLDQEANRVGMVLTARDGDRDRYYVVLPGRVAPVSDFVANLLLADSALVSVGQDGNALEVSPGALQPGEPFAADQKWPTADPSAVNDPSGAGKARDTVCNVLMGVDRDSGRTTLRTWAGDTFPAVLATGSTSAYVTPGSGQVYQQFQGSATDVGPVFLVTDTGLRYVLQSNGDRTGEDSEIGRSKEDREKQQQAEQEAQKLLGYADVAPTPVPAPWSAYLPTGPRLSTADARQPQGS